MKSKPKDNTVKQLENWFVVDKMLFENDAKKVIKSGSLFREYLSLKASFLSNLNEFYQHLNLKFNIVKPKNEKVLQEQADEVVKKSKALATSLLSRESTKKTITEQVRIQTKKIANPDINKISDIIVESKFQSLSIDNAFIGIPMMENKIQMIPDDFKAQIYFEAYKLQRNALIQIASKVKNNV